MHFHNSFSPPKKQLLNRDAQLQARRAQQQQERNRLRQSGIVFHKGFTVEELHNLFALDWHNDVRAVCVRVGTKLHLKKGQELYVCGRLSYFEDIVLDPGSVLACTQLFQLRRPGAHSHSPDVSIFAGRVANWVRGNNVQSCAEFYCTVPGFLQMEEVEKPATPPGKFMYKMTMCGRPSQHTLVDGGMLIGNWTPSVEGVTDWVNEGLRLVPRPERVDPVTAPAPYLGPSETLHTVHETSLNEGEEEEEKETDTAIPDAHETNMADMFGGGGAAHDDDDETDSDNGTDIATDTGLGTDEEQEREQEQEDASAGSNAYLANNIEIDGSLDHLASDDSSEDNSELLTTG